MQNKISFLPLTMLAVITLALLLTTIRASAQEKVLYSLPGGYPSGPSRLIFDGSGNLYGMTVAGGSGTGACYNGDAGCGTFYEVAPQAGGGWAGKVLLVFNNTGSHPWAPSSGLIADAAGNLYGTTIYGGLYGYGTVFELSLQAAGYWKAKLLYSFNEQIGDGIFPGGGLIFDTAGNLYGTTIYPLGTVFKLTPQPDGSWKERVLHTFSGADGEFPDSAVTIDASGNLYGTTFAGGAYNYGTVYELTPAAGGVWTVAVLHSFNNNKVDGYQPSGKLLFDAAGNLYGTTEAGGGRDNGTVFELSPRANGVWAEKVIHTFGSGTDGSEPYDGVVSDVSGNLYGTTLGGGAYALGTVFELKPAAGGGWTEALVHSFGNGSDGVFPGGGLIFDSRGNLYGTTGYGGANGTGTVFEIKL